MVESELISFGLTPRQAKIYMVLLRLQESTASRIAELSRVPRLTTYAVLERLHGMDLVSVYKKRRVRIYRVNPPEALLRYCDDEISSIQKKRQHLKNLLPQLKSFLSEDSTIYSEQVPFRLIEDQYFLEERVLHFLSASPEWHVVSDGSLISFLESISNRTAARPRLIFPCSKRRFCEKSLSSDFPVRYFPDALLKDSINLMLMGSSAIFLLGLPDSFLAIEFIHAPVVAQLKSFFWVLWERECFTD